MLRKIILLILLTIIGYSPVAMAGFWSALGACFTDPCNCGLDPKYRQEYHQGSLIRSVKKNYICPPWNKNGGRHDNTCLVLKHYPDTPTGVYENLCAEGAPDSTYFTPRIRVRGQQCNVLGCWTTDNTLDWDGDCVTLAGGYGAFPLHRMCARIALPKDDIRDFAQDPGYTNGVHLDYQGSTVPDEVILGSDGQPISYESPKLCLYRDPAFMSVKEGVSIDFMDLDPNHQSMHKTDKIHPVIEVILFFLSIATDADTSLADLIGSLVDMIFGGGEEGETTFGSVIKDIFAFVGEVISWVGDLIKGFLEEIGQINRAVDEKKYGCVNLPLGPMPPPFCEQVAPFFQVADVQDICETGAGSVPVESVSNKECHVSTLQNNYIRNSVRVGYEELVPLCKEGEDPNTTDKCVDIENIGAFSSAKGMHTVTARRDIVKHCDAAVSGEPCVKSMVPHSCSVTSNGCQTGFRIVYGHNLGGIVTPKSYYRDDIPDCPSSGSATCQEIWGINRGEFQDISLAFPNVQSAYDISPLVNNFELVDKGGRTAYFNASIVRVSGFDPTYGFRQEPKQLCVFEGEFVAGCRERAQIFKPNVYECTSSPNPSVTCSSSYFAPKFVVSYSAGSDSTSAMIEPESVYNPGGVNNIINLAGNEFESFVTDNSFQVKPFSGGSAPNPSSLFGTYQHGVLPVSGTTINPDAVYLSGLEYINGKYHLGGKYACLSGHNYTKCPQNPKMCILSNLLNRNTVLCSTFFSKSIDHGGLSLCAPAQSGCPVVDTMPRISGGVVNIKSCPGGDKCYENSVELCQISLAPNDRVSPSSSLGLTLGDDQYYNTATVSSNENAPPSNSANYNDDLYGVRDKTPVELGLCVAIPQGSCPAETGANEDTAFATWPSVNLGEVSYGTCHTGRTPNAPLSSFARRCIANPDTQSFNLEPLYKIERAPPFNLPDKTYPPSSIKCNLPPPPAP